MKKYLFILSIYIWCAAALYGQRTDYAKMSSLVRQLAIEQTQQRHQAVRKSPSPLNRPRDKQPELCAFVRVTSDAQRIFQENDSRPLAQFGDIYIVSVPLQRLGHLSSLKQVQRIEAGRGNTTQMDSVAFWLNATPAYQGKDPLPHAFTGKDVVVGVQDVGFDLTHPNFYDSPATHYRIKRFWDQLSADTLGSTLYVGASYEGRDALLAYQHSRDGLIQTHGTHTLGIAAGSGYDSPYRGMAYESDICLVSNAVSDDEQFIDSADYYKYTYATDALGFKYIMDYAQERNLPCVISFSEGSNQDFHGDDQLYYAILDSLSGPGRIIVASAGNEGAKKSFFRKPIGIKSAGTFVSDSRNSLYFTLKSPQPFTLRLTSYGQKTETLTIPTTQVLTCSDSLFTDTVTLGGKTYRLRIMGYTSSYHSTETAYDVLVKTDDEVGLSIPFSFEVVGADCEIEAYRGSGNWTDNALAPQLNAGERTHNILSPGSAPSVICVGASSYRTAITNYRGERRVYDQGTQGQRGEYSSVGPTYDERMKPDVLAPGTNIISSYSSYYLEANPNAFDVLSDVAHFNFKGRQYAWNSNSGTSMSTPVVAGAIALWLQAKPTLTKEEIMNVLAHTCSHTDPSLTYPNNKYGYGQIDVYKGLLYILGVSGIETITQHQPRGFSFSVQHDGLVQMRLHDVASHHFSVSVYAVSGGLVKRISFPAGQTSYSLDLSTLPKGVYVVQVNSHAASMTGSTLIRR